MTEALIIGRVAQAAGVPAKTIRYYEEIGVLPRPSRSAAGYRQYTRRDVERLIFVRRARAIGLSLDDLKALTTAIDDGSQATVRPRLLALVRAQLSSVHEQIAEFRSLQQQLEQLLRRLLVGSPGPSSQGCRCLESVALQTSAGSPRAGGQPQRKQPARTRHVPNQSPLTGTSDLTTARRIRSPRGVRMRRAAG